MTIVDNEVAMRDIALIRPLAVIQGNYKYGTTPRALTQENMVMSPAGVGTKNECAGEGQQ
jgi:hypothetical protein